MSVARRSALLSRLVRYVDVPTSGNVKRVRYVGNEIGIVVSPSPGLWLFYGNQRDGYRFREGHGATRSEAVLSAYPIGEA